MFFGGFELAIAAVQRFGAEAIVLQGDIPARQPLRLELRSLSALSSICARSIVDAAGQMSNWKLRELPAKSLGLYEPAPHAPQPHCVTNEQETASLSLFRV
ncbi:UNVERIFIED_ORG: hypothetical protein ABIC43_004915 [Variovorax guangxiensis]